MSSRYEPFSYRVVRSRNGHGWQIYCEGGLAAVGFFPSEEEALAWCRLSLPQDENSDSIAVGNAPEK